MAFYLKYRPQKIGDLDLPEVKETLYGLLAAKTLPHALLCTGIRGTGKTSSARILAKAINCERNLFSKDKKHKKPSHEELEPCNECEACISILKARSLDVVEIDAASHRGIDDIRDLREKVKLASTALKYKIYIIDEVHMLTTEAFNALLKTLEEPPARVLFVLCTTELEKLPDTVISRCVQVPFRRARTVEVVNSLRRVVKGEEMEIDDAALELLAELGDGSFRDATKLLEEVSWMSGGINREKLEAFYHLEGGAIVTFVAALQKRSAGEAIGWIEDRVSRGVDIKRLTRQILMCLHEELLCVYGMGKGKGVFESRDKEDLRKLIGLLDDYWWRFGTTEISQLPLELAVLEWFEMQRGEELVLRKEEQPVVQVSPVQARVVAPQEKKSLVKPEVLKPTVRNVPVPVGEVTIMVVRDNWESIMQLAKKTNFSVEALLRAVQPARIEGNKLVLEVAYSFHRDKLQEDGSRRVVEGILLEALGISLQVWCELVSQPKKNEVVKVAPAVEVKRTVESAPQSQDYVPKIVKKPENRGRGKIAKDAPVASADDEELVKFAEELFG